MNIYLVGGAVRDELLGLPVAERDYLVVGATEGQMLERGFERLDVSFPVFLHPQTGDEYALARRERKVGPGYKGFEVEAGPDVSLEQDLARRDLTINALARGDDGRVIDLFHGRDDLDAGILRHITPAFEEDPVRVLRLARFSAKLGRWGFRPAHATFTLLKRMSALDELDTLVPDRLREEMKKVLATEQPWRFFQLLYRCGALPRLLPELAVDFGKPAGHGHGDDAEAPSLEALRRISEKTQDRAVRFATLFAACLDADQAQALVAARLSPGREAGELLNQALTWPAPRVATAEARTLLKLVEQQKLLHRPERLQALAELWRAVDSTLGEVAQERLHQALEAAGEVQAADLMADGLKGPEIGKALRERRLRAIARRLER